MQFTYPEYYTGCWTLTLSLNMSDNINELYSNHMIELLTYLNECQIFKMTGYILNREDFYTDSEEIYTQDFWLKIIRKIQELDIYFLDLCGETMVYKDNKPVWLEQAVEIGLEFGISEPDIYIIFKLRNDDWLPYYFIQDTRINDDYEINSSRLEKCLTKFFCEKYQYDIEPVSDSNIKSIQNGFCLDNIYTIGYPNLITYGENGSYLKSTDPKTVK